MNRFLVVVFGLFFIFTASSQNTAFSRWSFAPEYGYNRLDGDVAENLTRTIPSSFQQVTYGATVEYALTPIWGLALDYYYFPLRASNTSPIVQISTNLYTSDFNATINFTRFIFPQSKSKFYVNGSIGLGYAYYTYNVSPSSLEFDVHHSNAVSVPITLSLEYNFSKPFALGVKGNYRIYNKDDLEGVKVLNYKGVSNDFVEAATLFLRYKFCSKRRSHLRNTTINKFSPDEGVALARLNDDKINKLDSSLNKLEKKVDNQTKRIDSLYVFLSNDGPDTDGDGVPDVRDLEPDTPPNTPVDFRGRSLKIPVNSAKSVEVVEDIPAVYFDFDKFSLDDNALVAISKIAAKMKADPDLYLEVRGYCDYSGNNPYNNQLSQRRSDRVKAELVNIWKIPSNHIISNGKGKVIEPPLKYRPNRRCDFFFGKL